MSDLISRQDAINAIENTDAELTEKDWDELTDAINALPSADAVQIPIKLEKRYPQSRDEDITDAFMRGYLAGRSSADRPTGEWQDEHGKPMRWTSFAGYCSNCGKWSEYLTDYCGNCGAKMGGDNMMQIDPVSLVYGLVIGTVIACVVCVFAIYWEEKTRNDE